MRILLTSDTHIGLTNPKTLEKMFKRGAEFEVDVVVHAGDYCGGRDGVRSVKTTSKLMRSVFKNVPILSVLGNHDYWGSKSEAVFEININKITSIFADNGIHWLDVDGPWGEGDTLFAGHTGWYNNPEVKVFTNDSNFMPSKLYGKEMHNAMAEAAHADALVTIGIVEEAPVHITNKIWVSHFPVINPHHIYGGSASLGNHLKSIGFSYFMEGHSHKSMPGPLVYNCGSDYKSPKYMIINI